MKFNLFQQIQKLRIGFRIIKTALATPLSLAIAQFLGTSNVATAGILTMLCIQPSRKKSFETASQRFLACLLAIGFSVTFFELLGYSPLVLSLLLMIFIPATIFLKIESGIMTSTVITLNIYIFKNVNMDFIYNQFYLIIIGIGTGFLVNLYMPSLEKKIERLQKSIEKNFQVILLKISQLIQGQAKSWNQQEIKELKSLFAEAEEIVLRDKENRLSGDKNLYSRYFEMRKHQLDSLQDMLIIVNRMSQKGVLAQEIALFYEKLSQNLQTENAKTYQEELQVLRHKFKQENLPQSHDEFEAKSVLFHLLYEIESFLASQEKK